MSDELSSHNTASDVRGAVVQAGSIDEVHVHPSAPEPQWPLLVGRVPPRANDFQPREVELSLGRAWVLSGPAGAGKTQIVAEFARTAWQRGELDLLVWVTAERSGLDTSSVHLPFYRLAEAVLARPPSDWLGAALDWLAATPKRWLLVLDGAESLDLLAAYLPQLSPNGTAVVTTRRRDHALRGDGRTVVRVDPFSRQQSLAYLRAALPDRHDGAAELADELGDLPLALAQSAAYIADNEFLTCASYLERLAADTQPLGDLLPEELPDAHAGTVVAVLELSLRHANRSRPARLAEPLLVFASMLSAEGVPLVLFTAPATLGFLEGFTTADVTPELVMDALATMHRLNLITLDARAPHATVRVHAVLRRVVRDRLPEDRMPDLFYAAVVAVVEARTGRDAHPPQLMAAINQCGTALHAMSARSRFRTKGQFGLLTRHNLVLGGMAGGQLHDVDERLHVRRGGVATVEEARLLVERMRGEFGADHRETLTARHHLARMLGEHRDHPAAVEELERLAADYDRVLGADHPHTLTARHNLVYWRVAAGARKQAAAEARALVADRERVLGADHPHTILSRYNLDNLRGY